MCIAILLATYYSIIEGTETTVRGKYHKFVVSTQRENQWEKENGRVFAHRLP